MSRAGAPLKTRTLPACPSCGGASSTPFLPCEDRLHGMAEGLWYSRCGDCGVRFLSTRVADECLIELYPEEYPQYRPRVGVGPGAGGGAPRSTSADRVGRAVARVVDRLPDALRRTVERAYRPPFEGALLLDVGCGTASFLAEARDRRWRAVGVDFNPDVTRRIAELGFESMLVDDVDQLPAGSVHHIRMSHVLEHAGDPPRFLAQFQRVLAPGGTIHVAIPNPIGISARVFGRDWKSFDARHLVLYTPGQARAVLDAAGFRVTHVRYEATNRDWLRSRAYRRLRKGMLRRTDVERLRFDGWGACLLPAAKLAAFARVGDRVHLFAVATAPRLPSVNGRSPSPRR